MELIIYLFGFFAVFGLGAYAAHAYHVEQREKEQKRIIEELNKASGIVEDVTQRIRLIFGPFGHTAVGTMKHPLTPQFYLEAALQNAIDREDYEEAARIRDLMNRK